MSKSRNFTFTWNNYPTDYQVVLNAIKGVKYLVAGEEIGESGTPHLQGFIQFQNPRVYPGVRLVLPGCHVEVAISFIKAIAYCKKDGKVFEIGKAPMSQKEKGESNVERYEKAWDLAKAGNLEEIDADIRIHCLSTLMKIPLLFGPVVSVMDHELSSENKWFYGPSGTGKSRAARAQFPGLYLKMCNKWWDLYSNESTILIEDFDKDHSKLIHFLKIWADRYPFPCEVKGGVARSIRPKRIIVTSNYRPDEIWDDEGSLGPIRRRFEWVHFPEHPVVIAAPKRPEALISYSLGFEPGEPCPVLDGICDASKKRKIA